MGKPMEKATIKTYKKPIPEVGKTTKDME